MTDQRHAKDTLFAQSTAAVTPFCFDDKVAAVFPDMIKRSIPGYSTILSMIGDMAERYAQADSYCYDLGCSLGAAILAMRHRIRTANCTIIGVDNSAAMIARCQGIIDADSDETPVQLIADTIESTPIENASMVVLNFTLQFIQPSQRQALLQRIFDGLRPGGVLLLSEKIIFKDRAHQALMTQLYHNFKRANGYSDTEIAQKRAALENVLIPDTLDTHYQRLTTAGFASAELWFQCFSFASLLAIKA
ncbi:MAG: carboxy-S-adenosyl-L-methionine synthase CmoA [Cellvibrionaceae bacterium]|nr:carboxy-S-adenosyl-L-methionine synthase CmoA [Cellvibrionaceae bacterium]